MDKVILQSVPPAPPVGQKLPEAKVVTQKGSETRVTVDTTQPVPKADVKKVEEKPVERPAWLPEEFKTPEEFAEHYKSTKAKPAEGTKPADGTKPAETPTTVDQAREAVTKAGLDMNKFSAEFAEKGALSEASIAELEKAGIPKTQVDAYIDGQKAVAAQYHQRLAESVGGEESLKSTFEWARTALTADEIAQADAVLTSGNEAQAKMLLAGLAARRDAALGREPEFISGRGAGVTDGPKGYESSAQMVADMNSALYRTDPAFRDQVMRRVGASKF